MKFITRQTDGSQWYEIETKTEAFNATQESETAFGFFFEQERDRGGTGRYFVLKSREGLGLAFCRTPPADVEQPRIGLLSKEYRRPVVVARYNADPFLACKDAIGALSRALQIHIDETCYPYGRHDPAPDPATVESDAVYPPEEPNGTSPTC